jgi:hypothetical protein
MMGSTFKRGINYSSTYILLVKDYIAFLGAKAIPVAGGGPDHCTIKEITAWKADPASD